MAEASWNRTRRKGHRAKINESIGKRLRMNLSKYQRVHLDFSKLNSTIAFTNEIPNIVGANSRCDCVGGHEDEKKEGMLVKR